MAFHIIEKKNDFWNHLINFVSNLSKLSSMCGNLNEIVDSLEKFGGHHFWKRKLHLKQFLYDVARIDLKFVGGRFTWDNRQGG